MERCKVFLFSVLIFSFFLYQNADDVNQTILTNFMKQTRRKEILPSDPVTSTGALLDNVKPETYKYLQRNQEKFWKRFLYAMLQRLHFTFKTKSSGCDDLESWVQNTVSNCLNQLAIPSMTPKIFEVCEKYNSEKKLWEKTFQQMLEQQKLNKIKFQEQLADLHEDYRVVKNKLNNQKKDIAKMMVRYGVTGSIDWINLVNTLGEELQAARGKINSFEEQQTCLTDSTEKLKFSATQNSEISAIISKSTHSSFQPLTNSLFIAGSGIKGIAEEPTEILNNSDSLDQESHLDLSEKKLSDHSEQVFVEEKSVQTQDISLNQSANLRKPKTESVMMQVEMGDKNKEKEMSYLLLRMAQVQKQIKEKNDKIEELTESKEEIVKFAKEKIEELQNEIDLGVKLYDSKNQQLTDLQQQYNQIVQKSKAFVRQYLNITSSETPFDEDEKSNPEEEESRKIAQKCKKCQELQNHLMNFIQTDKEGSNYSPIQSEDEEEISFFKEEQEQESLQVSTSELQVKKYIEKSEVSKYLIRYMELEINNGRLDDKISTLLTAVEAVDPNEEQREIIEDYSRKMTLLQAKELSHSSLQNNFYSFFQEEEDSF